MPARRRPVSKAPLPIMAVLVVACNLAPQQSVDVPPALHGSVLLEDGKCCVGAVAGEETLIQAVFQVSDPSAQMRIGSGLHPFDEVELSKSPWEPFSTTRTFRYLVPINWTGFYVTAQFKDKSGKLSSIYSDDISVEGMPAGYPLSTP